MELLVSFGHHLFRRDSLGPASADFLHASSDFLVPSGLDFRRGKAFDAGEKFLHKFNAPRGRPSQDLLRERFLYSRHGWSVGQGRGFGKRADGQGGVRVRKNAPILARTTSPVLMSSNEGPPKPPPGSYFVASRAGSLPQQFTILPFS
jgi:hypothetical protein